MIISKNKLRRTIRSCSLRQMRRQRMIGRLIEEGRFFGSRLKKLFILVVDVGAELDRLIPGHPRRQVNPRNGNLLR